MGRPYTLEDVQRVIANSDLEESKKTAQLKVTEPRPYTVEDVERVIARNKERNTQQKPVTGELWERVPKSSTEIPYVRQSEKASEVPVVKVQPTIKENAEEIEKLNKSLAPYMQEWDTSMNRQAEKPMVIPSLDEGILSAAAKRISDKVNEEKIPTLSYLEGLQHLKGYADVDTMLLDDYKMSKEERAYAKQLYKDYMADFSKKMRSVKAGGTGELSQAEASRIMLDPESDYQKLTRLNNKASSMTSFAMGLFSSMPFADSLMKKGDEMLEDQFGEQYGMSEAVKDAELQNAVAAGAGKFVGNAALYQTAGGIMEQIPGVSALKSKAAGGIADLLGGGAKAAAADPVAAAARAGFANAVGNSTANILSDLTLDVGLDTVPHVVSDVQEGKGTGEVAKNALGNVGMNLLYNAGGEAVSHIPVGKLIGKAKSALGYGDDATKGLDENLSLIKALEQPTATSTTEQIAEPLEQLVEDSTKTISPEYLSGEDFSLEDIAKVAQRNPDIPKSILPSSSKFAKADKDMSKLVKWYGNDDTVKYLEDFRKSLSDFENTGSLADFRGVEEAVDQIEKAIKGKTYTSPDLFNKNGTLKHKGVTYTYGDAGSIDDVLDEMMDVVEEVYVSKKVADNISTAKGAYQVASADIKSPSPITADTGLELTAKNNIASSSNDVNSINNFDTGRHKISETRTNTLAKSGIASQAELDKHFSVEDFRRMEISEKESIEEATKRIINDPDISQKLLAKEGISSIDSDTLMMSWRDTIEKARASGGEDAERLWKQANLIAQKVTDEAHNQAQLLQSLKKWKKTPEGAVTRAVETINRAVDKISKSTIENADTLVKKTEEVIKKEKKKVLSYDDAVKELQNIWKSTDGDEYIQMFENMLNSSSTSEHIDIKEIVYKAKGIPILTAESQKNILNLAYEMQEFAPNSMESKKRMAQIGQIINKEIPVTFSEKVRTILYDNMLGNFRTLISRNAGGNVFFNAVEKASQPIAATIDRAVSLKTGKRTTTGWNGDKLKAYLSGFATGLKEELSDVKTGLHTAKSGFEGDLEEAVASNRRIFQGKIKNKLDQLVKNGLSIGDRPFYEAAYRERMVELGELRSKYGFMGDLTDADFKVEAENAAKLTALEAVYQNDGKMSQAFNSLKMGLGKMSEAIVGQDVVSQFAMPFVKTPANVLDRSIEYNPLGILKNAVTTGAELKKGAFNQKRFVNETTRNLLGTGAFAAGLGLYNQGRLTAEYNEDKDMRAAQKSSGMQEYALDTGDGYLDYTWIPVLGTGLASGASFAQSMENGEGDLGQAFAKGTGTLLDQSLMQGMNRMFGGNNTYSSDKTLIENMYDTVKSGVSSQTIPSLVNQGANVIDDTSRQIYANDRDYELNSLINRIPVLRSKLLEPKIDNRGNDVLQNQGRGLGSRIFENMISPAKYTEKVSDPVNDEAMRLFEATGEVRQFLPTAEYSPTINGEKIDLSSKEYTDYARLLGKTQGEFADSLINSDFYKGLSDSDKVESLSEMYSAAKALGYKSLNESYEPSGTTAKLIKVYEDQGTDGMIDYMMFKAMGDKDGNGSINQDEAQAILDSSDLSRLQKAYYWQLFNSGWKKNPYQ